MSNEAKEQFLQRFKYELLVKMAHQNTKTGKKCFLSLEEESKGTQCFFKLLGPWAQTVAEGITVFVDEIDASPFCRAKKGRFLLEMSLIF